MARGKDYLKTNPNPIPCMQRGPANLARLFFFFHAQNSVAQ